MMKLFEDTKTRKSFPSPIARAVEILMAEIEESGTETTADETANLIDATLCHLGRLWVAEYLELVGSQEDAISSDLNELIFERLSQGKPVLIGQWVALARMIRGHFEKIEADTVMDGLSQVDFGQPGDTDHPVSRLTNFRNHFSHGSFRAVLREIDEHRKLIHDLLAKIPGLRKQPIVVRETETGLHLTATGGWEETDQPEKEPLADAQPIVTGKDGRRLHLYPLLQLVAKNGARGLVPAIDKDAYANLFHKPGLDIWLERYDRERRGYLEYEETVGSKTLSKNICKKLEKAMAQPGLILVEARPGCGGSSVVASLGEKKPAWSQLVSFAAIGRVAVRPDCLGQSGFTVAQLVLRLIERGLDLKEEHYQANLKNILSEDGPLTKALQELKKSKSKVLLGLDGLHHGVDPYRNEPWSVLDLYKKLADSPVTVVATMVPGGLNRPLFDHRIELPHTQKPVRTEIAEWVNKLSSKSDQHRALLKLLAAQDEELDLFAICDALEKSAPGKTPVFEPAVERALWDLRPLLAWVRKKREIDGAKERVLLWKLFHPTVGEVLDEALSA